MSAAFGPGSPDGKWLLFASDAPGRTVARAVWREFVGTAIESGER